MEQNKEGFSFTYSASEREEVRAIREKYTSRPEESKLDRLRRLDKSVGARAQTVALSIGIIGALILGFGMSLIMTELAAMLGIASAWDILLGLIIGIIGGGIAALAYPIYKLIYARDRERLAPEIIALTEELMG